MTVQTCQACEGNGYHYNKDIGEITGYCPQCDGEGFVEKVIDQLISLFHVELNVAVTKDALFHESIRREVESIGWSLDGYPVQSDLLLQLLIQFFDQLRRDGITLKSASVGKKIVYVNSVDLEENNNQPTLF